MEGKKKNPFNFLRYLQSSHFYKNSDLSGDNLIFENFNCYIF